MHAIYLLISRAMKCSWDTYNTTYQIVSFNRVIFMEDGKYNIKDIVMN